MTAEEAIRKAIQIARNEMTEPGGGIGFSGSDVLQMAYFLFNEYKKKKEEK